jgi:predicted amidophosphoribosyltransferase
MKFCYQCGKASAGDPLFCTKCGRTYDVRLCPRLHRNSRFAKACSQCGSRELSQAQPQVSLWGRVLEFLAKVAVGVFLVYVSLTALLDILRRPQFQAGLLIVGVLIGLLWWVWSQLPEWFRKLVWRSSKHREHDRER